jgi:hypothetical protein
MCRPGQRPRQGHRQASRRSLTPVSSAGGALTRQAPRPLALKATVCPTAVPEPAFAPVGSPWRSSGISVSIGSAAPAAPNPPSASHHNADLSSRARSRDPCIAMTVGTDRVRHAETHPTGKSKKPVQPSLQKYSDFPKMQITLYPPLSCPSERGVGHRHERWDGMRWTQAALLTNSADADGEVVWS